MKKTVCLITGTRAEWGLLRRVAETLRASDTLQLRLIVTGAHLSDAFGRTVREIEAAGFTPDECIDILKFGTASAEATARTVAYTIEQFTGSFTAHRPDMCLVLGDRYEIFAAGTAAAILGIPLAHISGGDVTRGAADEFYRHCLTKMASVHFPSCEESARRVIAMGEDPASVHNVGGLGDENIRKMELLSKDALAEVLGFSPDEPYLLVTFHPETAGGADPAAQSDVLLRAIEKTGVRCVFTKANADAGGAVINEAIDAACLAHPEQYVAFTSMGVLRYLSAMKYCAAVAGNSSSGVVETPSMGVPAVNIGSRQDGRPVCENVICCACEDSAVEAALKTALSDAFRGKARRAVSPYNGGDTAARIVKTLEEYAASPQFGAPKCFYDGGMAP